jgi:hypothetical protein
VAKLATARAPCSRRASSEGIEMCGPYQFQAEASKGLPKPLKNLLAVEGNGNQTTGQKRGQNVHSNRDKK